MFLNNGFEYVPLTTDYYELLEAHIDILTTLITSNRIERDVKWRLLRILSKFDKFKVFIYMYMLIKRRLYDALRGLISSHYVFLFTKVK